MNNKINRKILLIIVILVLVISGGFYVWQKKLSEIQIPIFENDNPETIVKSLKEILNNHYLSDMFHGPVDSSPWWIGENGWVFNMAESNEDLEPFYYPRQWWVSDDGYNIVNPNTVSIMARGQFTNPSGSSFLNFQGRELNTQISKIFFKNGFTLNKLNSSKSELKGYDIGVYVMAFQKEKNRCTITVHDSDFPAYGYIISCSDNFQEAYQEQLPYLKALNDRYGGIYGFSLGPNETIHGRMGEYVWLNIGLWRSAGGVYEALFKDNGEEKELIYGYGGLPSCEELIQKQVPKEVYGSCIDTSGNIVN